MDIQLLAQYTELEQGNLLMKKLPFLKLAIFDVNDVGGHYVYRVSLLDRYAHMPMSPLEKWEKLEQLRFLHQGIKVQVALTQELPPHGVDTPEDLQALALKLSAQ